MKEKILAFLKTKLIGVPDSYLNGVADTFSKTIKEEKDIEATFTDGIIETLKYSASQLQIEGDKRINQAKLDLKTWQKEHGLDENGIPIKKPVGRPPKKDVDSDDSDEPDEKITAWAKKILADYTELKQKIDAQIQEKTLAALSEKVSKHVKLKDVDPDWLVGRNLIPKSEDEIEQLATNVSEQWNTYKQKKAEQGVIISVPPTGGGQQSEKSTIDAYLDEKLPLPKEPQGKILIKK